MMPTIVSDARNALVILAGVETDRVRVALISMRRGFRNTHAKQAYAYRYRVDRLDQRDADLVQLVARIYRCLHGPAARYVPEVCIFDFDRHRLSECLMLLAPRPDIVRDGTDAASKRPDATVAGCEPRMQFPGAAQPIRRRYLVSSVA